MEETRLLDLLVEVAGSQRKWIDLMNTIDQVFKDNVDIPIYQLERLRDIDLEADTEVIDKSLRMSGFNLTSDFMRLNAAKLRRMFYLLNAYYDETNGTEHFYKFMEMLLSRKVIIQDLYTEDYVTFYPQPYGPLNIDGGTWFHTTHVDVSVSLEGLEDKLIIAPNQGLEGKILELLYEVCPINMVVNNFFFTKELKGYVFFKGIVVQNPIKIYNLSDVATAVVDIEIVGPTQVEEGSQKQYYVQVLYDNNTTSTEFATNWNVSDLGLAGVNTSGLVTFGQVNVATSITLSVTHKGFTKSQVITINNVTTGQAVLVDILIDGNNTIYENSNGQYSARGVFSDGSIQNITPQWGISASSIATISTSGLLKVLGVEQDTDVTISAIVVRADNVTIATNKVVTIKNSNPRPTLVGLYITGPILIRKNVEGDTTAQYIAHAIYSDGNVAEVQPRWTVSTNAAIISNSGLLLVGNIVGTIECKVTAEYTEDDINTVAIYTVSLEPPSVNLLFVTILGQDTVIEETSANYIAVGTWETNAVTSTSYVFPTWTSDRFNIDSSGRFTSGRVNDQEIVNLKAEVVANGQVVIATKEILVTRQAKLPEYITVIGPEEVKEGIVAQYNVYVTWNDGQTTLVEDNITWTVQADNTSGLSINILGQLSVTQVNVGTIEVHASYIFGFGQSAITLTGYRTVVLTPIIKKIKQLTITGPSSVVEDERVTLTAIATYDDNTQVAVRPLWTVRSLDPKNYPEPDVDVVSSEGLVQGRPIKEEQGYAIVEARFFSKEAAFPITVVRKEEIAENVVADARIIGPGTFFTDYTPGYALSVDFTHLADSMLLSSDWELLNPADDLPIDPSIAIIDSNGYIRPKTNTNATIKIKACGCNGPDLICATLVVDMFAVGDVVVTPSSISVQGPDVMLPNTTRQFTCLLTYSDSSVEQVSPTWTITSGPAAITVDVNGNVTVPTGVGNTSFTINATYVRQGTTFTANKTVIVQVVPAKPIYGIGPIGVNTDGEITQYLLQTMAGTTNGLMFTLSAINPGDYMYFAHRSSLGVAKFTDINTNFEGGWDGASWPEDGSIGNTTGPIAVQRTVNGVTETWYLYRSDFGGIGEFTFRVDYNV